MLKLIAIVGATGSQGRSIVEHYQRHEPTWSIRGLTRNSSSEAAKQLANTGVEIVQADLNDVKLLEAAFKGATHIFAYTDFGSIARGPLVMGKFKAGKLAAPVGTESYKIEYQQGKNVADAAASVPGLERLVWSASPHVKRLSEGRYKQVFHFDAKAEVLEYMFGLQALAGKVSAAHMGAFVTNAKNGFDLFKGERASDGVIEWITPHSPDAKMPFIDIEKDAGMFVKALIDRPEPAQLMCVSEWMTSRDWSECWSRVTGLKSRTKQISAEQFIGGDTSGFKEQVLETALFVQDFGYIGGDEKILDPDDLQAEGLPMPRSTIADYVAREDWTGFTA